MGSTTARWKREERELATIDIKGKAFVQYTDLLNFAHSVGLVSLASQITHLDLDNEYAVASATARFADGSEFTAIGDASPQNVSTQMIAKHYIRMADTRAKARVLRDALNVDENAVEEIDLSDEQPERKPRQRSKPAKQAASQRFTKRAAKPKASAESDATATCDGCGAEIRGRANFPLDRLVEYSKKVNDGQVLCWDCQTKKNDAA